jgi:hypothetical protein
MAIYTVHNRYHEKFVGMFDGQVYEVGVKDTAFPDYIARHLQRQSIMRDNPITGERLYQLAILELGDDTSPIEFRPEDPFDRSDTDWPKTKLVPSGINRIARAPKADSSDRQVGTKES